MKKIIPTILCIGLALLSIGCSKGDPVVLNDFKSIPHEEVVYTTEVKYDYEYTTLSALLEKSSIVVLGTPTSEIDIGDGTSDFRIAVQKTFWGNEQKDLVLSAFQHQFDIGSQYIFFIQTDDDIFWIAPQLQLIDAESFFMVDNEKVEVPERFTDISKDISVDSLAKLISESASIVKMQSTPKSITERLDGTSLIKQSDYIFTGKVLDVTYYSKRAGGIATVSIIKLYKGEKIAETEIELLVPQGIIAGETYLFFRSDGLKLAPTRTNSVLKQGTPEYSSLIASFK
ncbi:MAG TPA: hypothetical protein VM577_16385 [Anaerovoracaceae bacterium]|nr:hypothetical protein [Anaerovoracaceae bacterium]